MDALSGHGSALASPAGGPLDRPPSPPSVPAARRPPRSRPAPRPLPETSEDYDHLSLDALRSYRTALQAEEGKVSYWRRILQARLDVVREGRTQGGTGTLDVTTLRPVLTDSRVGAGRTALISVVPDDDIPPLPDLRELWEREVPPADTEAVAALEADLSAAEQRLSEYRAALHVRLGIATGQLIARYRLEPDLCLSALPLPRPRRPGGA